MWHSTLIHTGKATTQRADVRARSYTETETATLEQGAQRGAGHLIQALSMNCTLTGARTHTHTHTRTHIDSTHTHTHA